MEKFPKTIVVVAPDMSFEDVQDFDLDDCTFYENLNIAVEGEVEDTKVAVYKLEKQGKVTVSRKVAFE